MNDLTVTGLTGDHAALNGTYTYVGYEYYIHTNPQTVGQEFAALEADIAALQATGTGGGSVVSVPAPVWDVDADNQALELQAQTTAGALEAAAQQFNTIQIKWGVYGDGSGETPDFVDRDVSTWLPSA